ncbi:ferredoxin reductase family protein [Nitratireductor sp. XY-223]|uniref:ferredoxin reductase family protein n=1 Tax=Nitratireductor sp. XY-223 TaxID=2561926 RepID=UPI00145AC518|nr:ferredoxin reductase family protein [Nitratireductor sp. XY-223]
MRPVGIILVVAAFSLPLYWFQPLFLRYDPAAVFSHYLGAAAIIAMAISQLLSTRLPFVEPVFGGLDRVYVLHKWLGIGAVCAVLAHDAIGAEIRGLGAETPLTEISEDFGEVAYYGLLILAGISVAMFIPYNLWRWTHKLMGAVFALAVLHLATALKPFTNLDPLGLYLLGFGAVGVLSYLHDLLDGPLRVRRHAYVVTSAESSGDAIRLRLAPEGRGLRHRPGQFAFIRFNVPGLGEAHPFSISSAPNGERTLEFTIKPLGDFTRRLKGEIRVGASASVCGPYGHFAAGSGKRPAIWIAGGIGVTPFLAMAQALPDGHAPVHLFYCVKDRRHAPCLAELEEIAAANPGFHIHLFESAKGRRLTADQVERLCGQPLAGATVHYCGPKPLRLALMAGLVARGLKPRRFHYEAFELRSGIGLARMIDPILGFLKGWGGGIAGASAAGQKR